MAKNNNIRPDGGLTYTSIPQAGKTIATLEGCENNMEAVLWKLVINNSKYLGYAANTDSLPLKPQYRGIVRVNTNDGDTWDEEVGKYEAYRKAMGKYHKDMDRNLRTFLADVRSLCAGVEHYLDKRNVDYSNVPTIEGLKKSRFTPPVD